MSAPRRPAPDTARMKELAREMIEVDSGLKKEIPGLGLLVQGRTTGLLVLSNFRRAAWLMVKSESPKVSKRLRLDLALWLEENGAGIRGEAKEPLVRWNIYPTSEVDEQVRAAAKALGVTFQDFVKGAVARAAEEVLNGHK